VVPTWHINLRNLQHRSQLTLSHHTWSVLWPCCVADVVGSLLLVCW
jgi:hypothetical protein